MQLVMFSAFSGMRNVLYWTFLKALLFGSRDGLAFFCLPGDFQNKILPAFPLIGSFKQSKEL